MKSARHSPTESHRIKVRNDQERPVDFFMEPWGTHFSMPPGAVFDVVVRSPHPGDFEVALGKGHITVYGWTTSVFSVYCDGGCLGGSEVPVPPAPSNVEAS